LYVVVVGEKFAIVPGEIVRFESVASSLPAVTAIVYVCESVPSAATTSTGIFVRPWAAMETLSDVPWGAQTRPGDKVIVA
jgi:hypothetical protein